MAECNCGNNTNLLFYACSGAANTGFLADQVARKLMKEGCGKMTCLAAVGAGLSGFHESALAAKKNVVIDGCPVACGKKIFDHYGLQPYNHLILTEHGVEKGKTEITESVIKEMTDTVKVNI